MNSSLMPLFKFIIIALLGGCATLTAATLVLDLGPPQARAEIQPIAAFLLFDQALSHLT
ncbi:MULTISPECIES: hypothetical protein [unclassified Pseudophaeobacter]|uniref:hypothetical protein n=1 Tax=unclassified Pseudophaeobacter TaxID=2637024 RepID=UPI0013C4831B|nr:hypothetical protein [Pseudophaeobacter sp. EL27]